MTKEEAKTNTKDVLIEDSIIAGALQALGHTIPLPDKLMDELPSMSMVMP